MLVALNALVFIYAVLRGFWEIVCEGPRVGWCLVAQGLFRDFSRFLHRSNSTGWLYVRQGVHFELAGRWPPTQSIA